MPGTWHGDAGGGDTHPVARTKRTHAAEGPLRSGGPHTSDPPHPAAADESLSGVSGTSTRAGCFATSAAADCAPLYVYESRSR